MKHLFYLFISVASIFTLLLVSNCAPRRTENSSDIFASGKINNRIDSCLSESDYTAKEVVIPKQLRNWFSNHCCSDGILLSFLKKEKATTHLKAEFPDRDALKNYEGGCPVPNPVFKEFATFDPVNQWSVDLLDFFPTKEDWIEQKIHDKKAYFYGMVSISDSFDSFLFEVESEKNSEEYLDKDIYMVNVHEDVITSVSRLFSVFSWDGFASCVYTHIDSNHTFSRASNTYFDDAYEKAEIEEFKFDKVGKIVLE